MTTQTPFTSIIRLACRTGLALLLLATSVGTASAAPIFEATIDSTDGAWSIDANRNLLLNKKPYLEEKGLNENGTGIQITSVPGSTRTSTCLAFKHRPDLSDPEKKQRCEYYAKQGITGTIFISAWFYIDGTASAVSSTYFSVIAQHQQAADATENFRNPFVDFDLTPGTQSGKFFLNVHIRNDSTFGRPAGQKNYDAPKSYELEFKKWHSILAEVKPDFTGGGNGYVNVMIDGKTFDAVYKGALGYTAGKGGQLGNYQQTFGLYRSNQNNSNVIVYYDNYTLSSTYADAANSIKN